MSELKLERYSSKTAFVEGNDVLFIQSESATSDSDARWLLDEVITRFNKHDELTAIATNHATRADELYEALECICSYLSEDGLTTMGLAKEIVNAQSILDKSRIEAEGK